MAVLEKITCTFNIFDTGRKHSGRERGYLLDNVRSAINSDYVQERLRLREMIGYVGHGVREMTKKMEVGEVDTAKLPNGQELLIKAIPACVCTDISIDDDGNITHTEEVIDNDEGRTLLGLHNSRVGGFSWASTGGKQGANTLIDKIFGFDYVVNPLFSGNRGFVLDSASYDEKAVLDSLCGLGMDSDSAVDRLSNWYNSVELEARNYRDQTVEYMNLLAAQNTEYDSLRDQFNAVNNQLQAIQSQQQADEMARITAFRDWAARSPVAIPAAVVEALIKAKSLEDLEGMTGVLNKAARINASSLPFGSAEPVHIPARMVMDNSDSDPTYGSVESAPEISMY